MGPDSATTGRLPTAHNDVVDTLTSHYRSGDAMRSRSVGHLVLTGTLDLPALPTRLLADWEREISLHMGLEPGDVEPLPLARARARWPGYRQTVQAMAGWTHSLGLAHLLADSEIAVMACRGARYHHDGVQYGCAAFCNLFLGEDNGLELHFPQLDRRIALVRGTAVLFDTGQPHAVVRRGSSRFDAADFAAGSDCSQYFLTWELPIEDPGVARALQVSFDVGPAAALSSDSGQLWRNGAPAVLCPDTGRWHGVT